MDVSGYEYTIDGENYIDTSMAAKFVGMSLTNFRNLMRGVRLCKEQDIVFKVSGKKMFFKKDNLKLLKDILSK